MKKLLCLAACLCLLSCQQMGPCQGRVKPAAPYGAPDDHSEYISGEYASYTFTYYCHGGKYISDTYISPDNCTPYKKDEYTSTGICY
jgi:hypothetical protein